MNKLQFLSGLIIVNIFCVHSLSAKNISVRKSASTVSLTRLSLEKATEVAKAAIVACRKKGIQIAATVVDRNGIVQVTLRDTITAPFAIRMSIQKAYTAANFSADTSSLKRQANSPIGRADGVMMSAGGVVIKVGGKLLGAVGVSGAPSGLTDEQCAKAGLKKLKADLELDL